MVRGTFVNGAHVCCDKILVSIATPSLVSLHAVRQKAWPTRCTSSWTDKSVPIEQEKVLSKAHTRLTVSVFIFLRMLCSSAQKTLFYILTSCFSTVRLPESVSGVEKVELGVTNCVTLLLLRFHSCNTATWTFSHVFFSFKWKIKMMTSDRDMVHLFP